MPDPLVSIGIPTYNRPAMLERSLISVLNQTYKNLEIIVSDNCSTDDGVANVLEHFTDPRIKIFKQSQNIGAAGNLNFVLNKFTGSYFIRLGDDDWLNPNYVEVCLAFLISNPQYVCAYGQTKIFTLENEFVKDDVELDLGEDLYSTRMIHFYMDVAQNGIYFGLMKSELIPLVGNKKQMADDWLAIARVCFCGKIKLIKDTSLNISQHGIGRSIESIVQALGLTKFNKYFPYFSICKNIYMDTLFSSQIYRKLTFPKRLSLARTCAKVIFTRFNVKNELRGSYKLYFKSQLNRN